MNELAEVVGAAGVRGHVVPRVHAPPLVTGPPGPCGCGCALTAETSDGFEVIEFSIDVLGVKPDEWQRWLLIHALERLPDGRPRFRRVLVVVARQNGKSYLMSILACYWMFLAAPLTILGSSTKTSTAVKAWRQAIELAKAVPELAAEIPTKGGVLTASGKEQWNVTTGSRYEPVASNEDGGRGDSLDRVICDELRQHHDYSAYSASYHAMRARQFAQWWGITSMGDDSAIVLNELMEAAQGFIKTGEGDPRLGLFGWIPPTDSSPLDPEALAMANPSLNRIRADGSGFMLEELLNEARVVVAKGGEALTDFKTEAMNIRVPAMNPALDAGAWLALPVSDQEGFADLRGRVAVCIDVAPGGKHVSLYAAARQDDGLVRIGLVNEWFTLEAARRSLPALVAKIRPRVFGWLPAGPAVALAVDLADRSTETARAPWPPFGVTVEEIRGDVPAVCQGFDQQVGAKQIIRIPDALLDDHVTNAERYVRGDVWVFSRRVPDSPVDALYAAAGAVHLARTLPPAPARLRAVTE